MEDKRKFKRWESSVAGICQWDDTAAEGKVVNLSFNGCCFELGERHPAGDSRVEVTLHNEEYSTSLAGRVAYVLSDPSRVGIEFTGRHEENVKQLMPFFQSFVEAGGDPAAGD